MCDINDIRLFEDPIWETDERKIHRNTAGLYIELEQSEEGIRIYYRIVRMFKRCEQTAISDQFVRLFQQLKENEKLINQYKERIDSLEKQLMDVYNSGERARRELNHIYNDRFGDQSEQYKKMKEQYLGGASLRKLARIYGCDKSTVKRRLIGMGVQINNKGGD